MVFWVNNNYDRQVNNYEDDVMQGGSGWPGSPVTSDCDYEDGNQHRVIPNTRDLEDFARLWICDMTSNLLSALPAGSTVTLSWADNWDLLPADPQSENPTIDLFLAGDYDGGMGYLTNGTVAARQTDSAICPYRGRLGPGGSLRLTGNQFVSGWSGSHFIWCGAAPGNGQLTLTIADGNSNVLAQASQWIQIVNIKQMYERWTVGDDPDKPPMSAPVLAVNNDFFRPSIRFQYPPLQDTNTPYIVYVHGWNNATWSKDRRAETAFKRLYWQGYQGRFGVFRWPTTYDFNWQSVLFSPDDYNYSEY